MSLKKKLFLLFFFPILSFNSSIFSATQTSALSAAFTSVTGKVTILHNHKSRRAVKDATVHEGDSITTASDASADLKFFDGSELSVMGGSKFVIRKMSQPTPQDKTLSFHLSVGKLFAKVKKLLTSSSSFEIEA